MHRKGTKKCMEPLKYTSWNISFGGFYATCKLDKT
jgi:hypothetical protein